MKFSVKEIAKSASRALGAIYSKFLSAGGMTFSVYNRLIESVVEPVLFYCSGIWGHNKFTEIETDLNKVVDISLEFPKIVQIFLQEVI